jgi:hypothetical protein
VCLLVATLAGAAACGGGTVPSGTAFCGRISDRLSLLRGLTIDPADPASARSVLTAYEDVGKVSPAPVRDAWTKLTKLVETAATSDLKTPEAGGKFAEQALAAQPDITTIKTYVKATCGIDLA